MKLGTVMDLTPHERGQLDRWAKNPKRLRARHTIIRQGDRTGPTCLMLEGWAARYKDLRNGKRQVVGLLLPGDMCDLHEALLRSSDHSITMLSDALVAMVSSSEMAAGLDAHPRLARALWWSTLADEGVLREWLLSIRQRDPLTRVASLFCELHIRAARVGLANESTFSAPMTQIILSEAMGMTAVHANRVMRALREQDLIKMHGKQVTIPDVERLASFCDFDSSYLQLNRRD